MLVGEKRDFTTNSDNHPAGWCALHGKVSDPMPAEEGPAARHIEQGKLSEVIYSSVATEERTREYV